MESGAGKGRAGDCLWWRCARGGLVVVVAEVIVGRRRIGFALGFAVAVISLPGVWLVVVLALGGCGRIREDLLGGLGHPVVVMVVLL